MKAEFIRRCRNLIYRDGLDDLLSWLEKSDFFTAPASSRFHNAYQEGLVEHSLHVHDEMLRLLPVYPEIQASEETVAIISLFHDLCKVNMYKTDTRNVKRDGQWYTEPYYSIDEKYAFGGHGSKSVYLVSYYMRLTPEEAAAINAHMASWDGNKDVGRTFEQYPLAWLLHCADESATYILESDTE
ncbi:MAG: hypothetical protein PHR82_06955 [Endomicrobiaceae bacterium]|nr:hypothetical protein [Endomicrobiaceae bacterium]